MTREEVLKKLHYFSEEILRIGIEAVRPQTRFADVGLDSLDMAEMESYIEEWISVPIGRSLPQTYGEAADLILKACRP